MVARRAVVFALLAVASLGAGHRTPNFTVEAPTAQLAQQIGQAAEQYRKDKAVQWLGQELPPWPQPCPITVKVSMNGSGGATSFAFDRGRVLGMEMTIEGSPERLLASVLPHEVTHTIFAHHFRQPVPRWADEGGSVLSEDELERRRHDQLCRQILNTPGRAIPLRRLFNLKQYPNDVMVLYAEGYSMTDFLVSRSSRFTFLAFVQTGMQQGWDAACQTHYGYKSVEALEEAWLAHLRETKEKAREQNQAILAGRGGAGGEGPKTQVVTRTTVPPSQPNLDAPRPVARGAMEEASAAGWNEPPVRLGAPQFEARPAQPEPAGPGPQVQLGSPVGYPRP